MRDQSRVVARGDGRARPIERHARGAGIAGRFPERPHSGLRAIAQTSSCRRSPTLNAGDHAPIDQQRRAMILCSARAIVPIVQRPRTWPFQGQNTGSNPVGDANRFPNVVSSEMGLDPEIGVYFRLRGSDFLLGSSAKERLMGSKRFNRRELLKSGATLAGGFTLGAAAPALGQEPLTHASPPMIKGDTDGRIAYGEACEPGKAARSARRG